MISKGGTIRRFSEMHSRVTFGWLLIFLLALPVLSIGQSGKRFTTLKFKTFIYHRVLIPGTNLQDHLKLIFLKKYEILLPAVQK